MKKNQEILDEYGRTLVKNVFDFNFKMLKHNLSKNLNSNELEKKIDSISKNTLESCLFDFLKIFEENEQFKLYYESKGQKVNLVEISEMLKSEPIVENGWIERFSTEIKK